MLGRRRCAHHQVTISFSSSLLDFKEAPVITGLRTVVLFVSDVERAARFYRDQLGLEELHQDKGRVLLHCGETRVLLHPTEDREGGACNVELYFEVDDVDGAVSRLREQGVGVLLEPTDEPWGERNAGLLDPDGYPIYLTQSLIESWVPEWAGS